MRRQTVYQQKRRELAWYLAGFIIVQLSLAVVIDRFWTTVRDPEYAHKESLLKNRIAEAPGRPLVLAIGSSRLLMGLRAAQLSNNPHGPLVFNFGIPASGPMMERTCLERLLKAGIRPDALVLEFMPLYLNQRDGCPLEEKHLDTARLRASELVRVATYFNGLDRLLLRWSGARVLPSYRHQAELRQALALDVPTPGHEGATPTQGMDAFGWQPHHTEVTPQQCAEFTQFALGQYEDVAADFQLAPEPSRALRNLLELCRREKIPTMLVLMPEGSAFRALYEGETHQQIDHFLTGLCGELDVPLIDARTWVADEGFWDAHHLLPTGAKTFTARFERETLRSLLKRLPSGSTPKVGPLARSEE